MEIHADHCCRTCLSKESLQPIFFLREHHEKYTNLLLNATGQEITISDHLTHQMCSPCIDFINNITKFRQKCQQTQKILNKLHSKENIDYIFTETTNMCIVDIDDLIRINISSMYVNENETYDMKDDNEAQMFHIKEDSNHEDDISLFSLKNSNNFDKLLNNPQSNGIAERTVETIKRKHKLKDGANDVKRRKTRSKTTVNINGIKAEQKIKKEVGIEVDIENGEGEKKTERAKESVECDICHKVLSSKLSLRNHYKIHTGFNVVCEHCGKKFRTGNYLLVHCRAKHGYEKIDKCSYCEYTGSNAEQIKVHERLHTGEQPFSCAHCDAKFHRRSTYLQHIAIHLPDKTVLCDKCPLRFKSVTLMRIHASKHSPPKYSYRCNVCQNLFARPRNVFRHMKRVHNTVGTRQDYTRIKL